MEIINERKGGVENVTGKNGSCVDIVFALREKEGSESKARRKCEVVNKMRSGPFTYRVAPSSSSL